MATTNNKIELQAALDKAKSVKNINKDIDKIKDQIKQLKIQSKLNPNIAQALAKELGKVLRQKISISNIGIDTSSAVKSAQQANKQIEAALNKEISSTKQVNLTNEIEKWLSNNTRATNGARQELELYLKELSSGSIDQEKYIKISNRLTELDTQMRSIGKSGKSLFQSLSEGSKKFTSWISNSTIVKKVITETRQAISTIKELDTAMAYLKLTSKMSASELKDFYFSANDIAKQTGVTTKEIIDQAAAWSRLGFNTAEAATEMTKYSSMLVAISPGMDLNSATNGLASVMTAFKIGLQDTDKVVDGIMSKINIISKTQAVNNSDIVDFLTRSSSAMAEANNTLEDTIALGTAVMEITRDAAGAGQILKTVSMRIRGYDEDTEEFIGNVEELSGKIADLTKTASTPDGISLFSDAAKTEFKSTRQLLQEISEIYDQLTDKDQAELLEALAGKQNGQAVSAILSNFDTVTASLESMANSAGNAEAEMAVAMDSIDYKLNNVKETGTGIAQNLLGREEMKTILDMITSLGNALDWVTDKLGLLGTIGIGGLGVGITKFVKNFA